MINVPKLKKWNLGKYEILKKKNCKHGVHVPTLKDTVIRHGIANIMTSSDDVIWRNDRATA